MIDYDSANAMLVRYGAMEKTETLKGTTVAQMTEIVSREWLNMTEDDKRKFCGYMVTTPSTRILFYAIMEKRWESTQRPTRRTANLWPTGFFEDLRTSTISNDMELLEFQTVSYPTLNRPTYHSGVDTDIASRLGIRTYNERGEWLPQPDVPVEYVVWDSMSDILNEVT